MIIYENECVGCPPEMGCLGDLCRYKRVPHYYCDICEEEFYPDALFNIDGGMVCEICAMANISYRELLEDKYGTVS